MIYFKDKKTILKNNKNGLISFWFSWILKNIYSSYISLVLDIKIVFKGILPEEGLRLRQ
jgi:hypothetical protein